MRSMQNELPASYSVSLSDAEADSGGVTEAGTTQRDVVMGACGRFCTYEQMA